MCTRAVTDETVFNVEVEVLAADGTRLGHVDNIRTLGKRGTAVDKHRGPIVEAVRAYFVEHFHLVPKQAAFEIEAAAAAAAKKEEEQQSKDFENTAPNVQGAGGSLMQMASKMSLTEEAAPAPSAAGSFSDFTFSLDEDF